MKEKMTYRQAFKKTKGSWIIAANVILGLFAYGAKDPMGAWFLVPVDIGYIIGLIGTRNYWRGFI